MSQALEQWWSSLVAAKALRGKQAEILHAIIARGPATSGEILTEFHHRNLNAWRGRVSELAARGLIREVGIRRCNLSGRLCVVWGATGRAKPLDPAKGNGSRRTPKESRAVREGWRKVAERLAGAMPTSSIGRRGTEALAAYHRMIK